MWLPSSDSQKWLGKKWPVLLVSKQRPFLGIPFNLSATPSTSLFQSIVLVDSRPLWFLFILQTICAWLWLCGVAQNFSPRLTGLPSISGLGTCELWFVVRFQYSVWICIISKPGVAPGRSMSMSLLDSSLHLFPPPPHSFEVSCSCGSCQHPMAPDFQVILIYSLPS